MKTIRAIFNEIRDANEPELLMESLCYRGLNSKEIGTIKDDGFTYYEGKVRQCFARDHEFFVLHTDRLSAFDSLIGFVPFKGMILNSLSDYWFRKAKDIVPSHFIDAPSERMLKVKRTTPVKAEVIVRGYLAGSMMKAYEEGKRDFCGNLLPEKLLPYQSLPSPIITPTTKAAAFEHDIETTADELVRSEIVTEKEWITITDMAYKLFLFGQKEYASKDWILVDTKYEFGRTPDGKLIVIDEIHTPDSSRIWIKDTYLERFKMNQTPEMLDKQHVRRWLQEHGFEGKGKAPKVPTKILLDLGLIYLDVAERLIGAPLLVPETPTKPVFN